jgi:hypothetical protein
MDVHLNEYFNDKTITINTILNASVHLAEKVNERTDLSGIEKTQRVVSTLKEFLGEEHPEFIALVQGVVPGMLDLIVKTARGAFKLQEVKKSWSLSCCTPSVDTKVRATASPSPSPSSVLAASATAVSEATPVTQKPTFGVWVRTVFSKKSTAVNSPATDSVRID